MLKSAFILCSVVLLTGVLIAQNRAPATGDSPRAVVDRYCAGCHNDKTKSGGFSWSQIDLAHPEQNAEMTEKVLLKLRAGLMPPAGAPRPDAATLKSFVSTLETQIDQAAATHPYIESPDLHRVNRTEYRNSVRDLLGLDVDVTAMLPPDASTNGFDNMSEALTVTPALMQAYIRAADKISRQAIGDPGAAPEMVSYNVPKVVNQMRHIDGTPYGTRGGVAVTHNFPADGEYTFKVELYYYYTGEQIGSKLPTELLGQQVEISVDGDRVAVFTIDPNVQETDANLVTPPIKVAAGEHRLAAAFVSKFDGPVQDQYRLVEQTLMDITIANQPQMTGLPHLRTLSVTGPFNVSGVSENPVRRRIFVCHPAAASEEDACASKIISNLSAQAFRRAVEPEDLEGLMNLFHAGRKDGNFETGIRLALQGILSKPEFIFRFERKPSNAAPGTTYRISDFDLASRLSYFLWSSAPDQELIDTAKAGRLREPATLEKQIRRMLIDPRSEALAANFVGQWLRLQQLSESLPEPTLFPDYTRNLGLSMRREVELLFDSVVREDRSLLDLLTADYTFVDEILAKHYGIPNVLGSRFRRVQLTDPNRFGLLGKAGILTMTSLANRTSPVARGKYVLEVLVGVSPPPPPPVVPKLKEAVDNEKPVPVRERMEHHRANPACASCHKIMDPIGLALENFDAVGSWRVNDSGARIDPSGQMYDGQKLDGPVSVQKAVLARSDAFTQSFTKNLLAYALGRVVDYRDMPTVRAVARQAASHENRLASFIIAIVESAPFQMRNVSSSTVER